MYVEPTLKNFIIIIIICQSQCFLPLETLCIAVAVIKNCRQADRELPSPQLSILHLDCEYSMLFQFLNIAFSAGSCDVLDIWYSTKK